MTTPLTNINLALLPITVETTHGKVEGFLLQAPSKGVDSYQMSPAAATCMHHGSPLGQGKPFFLYQTEDEVDEAVIAFLGKEKPNTPIYFLDPTGEVEWSGRGPKIGYQWPDAGGRCSATVTFRTTMRPQDAQR